MHTLAQGGMCCGAVALDCVEQGEVVAIDGNFLHLNLT